jgi:hypothetical protein
MGSKKSWFDKGNEGWKRAKRVDKKAKEKRDNRDPWRFRLKNDESGKVTFLDNPSFFVHEHNLRIDGKFGNFFTCVKDFDTCPVCEDGDTPGYIVVATVIDHTVWEDREGKKHRNQKKLFVGKGKARQSLLRQIERRDDDLKYCVYEMSRGSSSTECSTGEDYEFLKRLNRGQTKKFIPAGEKDSWLEPFDYEELFTPKSIEELSEIIGAEPPVGSEKDDADNGGEKEESSDDGFDVDALQDELEEKNKKGLKKFIEDEELDLTVKANSKEGTIIKNIIEAMKEKFAKGGGKSDDDGDGDGDGGGDDLDIDDLI